MTDTAASATPQGHPVAPDPAGMTGAGSGAEALAARTSAAVQDLARRNEARLLALAAGPVPPPATPGAAPAAARGHAPKATGTPGRPGSGKGKSGSPPPAPPPQPPSGGALGAVVRGGAAASARADTALQAVGKAVSGALGALTKRLS